MIDGEYYEKINGKNYKLHFLRYSENFESWICFWLGFSYLNTCIIIDICITTSIKGSYRLFFQYCLYKYILIFVKK